MSLEKLKSTYHAYRKDPYSEINQYNYNCAIYNFLTGDSFLKSTETILEEPYVPVLEFYNKTHIGHPTYINALALRDKDFQEKCARRNGNKWEVKIYAACKYISTLKGSPKAMEARRFLEKNYQLSTYCHPSKLLIT